MNNTDKINEYTKLIRMNPTDMIHIHSLLNLILLTNINQKEAQKCQANSMCTIRKVRALHKNCPTTEKITTFILTKWNEALANAKKPTNHDDPTKPIFINKTQKHNQEELSQLLEENNFILRIFKTKLNFWHNRNHNKNIPNHKPTTLTIRNKNLKNSLEPSDITMKPTIEIINTNEPSPDDPNSHPTSIKSQICPLK